jgi:alpha-N-arabinofuranosidase
MDLNVDRSASHTASEFLLGQNIETCLDTVPGLLSDRLENPKFLGPCHVMSGHPPGWEGPGALGTLGVRHVPGAGLMGADAVYLSGKGATIVQGDRRIAGGETLVAEIWARCVGEPVTLALLLMPKAYRQYFIAAGDILVDCPQFTRYTLELKVPSDHDDASFSIAIAGESDGTVCLDQVHLRPQGEDLLCAQVVEQMESMQIPTIRFPGGIISTTYNWRHGTGPVHLRPTLHDAAFFKNWTLFYDFGTDEYLQLCLDQGIAPTITLNIATGDVDEARSWAEYAVKFFRDRGAEPPAAYWQIGNHPFFKTMAFMTSDMYVETVRKYAPAIREAYPNAKIVGVSQPPSGEDGEGEWLTKTLDEVGGLLDVIQCQCYGMQGIQPRDVDNAVWNGGTSDLTEMMGNLASGVDHHQKELTRMIESCRQRGLATNVGVAEWNYWTTASGHGEIFHEPDDALHALFIAGMLIGFAALAPDLEVAHYYNLVNCMGILIHRGPGTVVHAGVDVFRMFRPAFPGEFLPVDMDAPALGESKSVHAAALRSDGQIHLLLVNYSATEPADIRLHEMDRPVECICMSSEDPRGRPQFTEIETGPEGVTLPPLSLARLAFSAP